MNVSPKILAKTLRKHLEDPGSFEVPADGLAGRWLAELGLGIRMSKALKVDRSGAAKARTVLLRMLEADDFSALDAKPATREETLLASRNEKLLNASPRASRVAVKAFPGHPLFDAGRELLLEPGDNLEIDGAFIGRFASHDVVVAVENWESFERLPALDSDMCARMPKGSAPLAIWRGTVEHPVGAALRALAALGKPCYAYVDFDPSGLSIAQSMPGFVDMLAPPASELARLFATHGRTKLFADQRMPRRKPASHSVNWNCTFDLCNRFAAGLPQEHF